jgi:hypothetical protein
MSPVTGSRVFAREIVPIQVRSPDLPTFGGGHTDLLGIGGILRQC